MEYSDWLSSHAICPFSFLIHPSVFYSLNAGNKDEIKWEEGPYGIRYSFEGYSELFSVWELEREHCVTRLSIADWSLIVFLQYSYEVTPLPIALDFREPLSASSTPDVAKYGKLKRFVLIRNQEFWWTLEDPFTTEPQPTSRPQMVEVDLQEEDKLMFKLFPYKPNSVSAKNLAEALGIARLRRRGSLYQGGKFIINWGASAFPDDAKWVDNKVFNPPHKVRVASNKLLAFEKMKGLVSIPEFTTDIEVAKGWCAIGKRVVCRTSLNGHGGEGIKIARNVSEIVEAPLYTQYIKKEKEYRVHVGPNEMEIYVHQKILPSSFTGEPNFDVRNHANGFIFVTPTSSVPPNVMAQASQAISVLELDFGAVDVIYNDYHQTAYVLEVNTAPGIEGRTVEFYRQSFTALHRRLVR